MIFFGALRVAADLAGVSQSFPGLPDSSRIRVAPPPSLLHPAALLVPSEDLN